MLTLEAPAQISVQHDAVTLSQHEQQLFQALVMAAQLTAHEEGLRPIGTYRPPTPTGPMPKAVGRAAVVWSPPAVAVSAPLQPERTNWYFHTRKPPHIDDEPLRPFVFSGERELPVSHRLSVRRPADYTPQHRNPEQGRIGRRIGRALGYLAASATVTTGLLAFWQGTSH